MHERLAAPEPPRGEGTFATSEPATSEPDTSEPATSEATPFGVYVHFPWCLKKCPYCDFVSFKAAPDDIPHERYADAVIAELDGFSGSIEGELATVFFGGGTPSLWSPKALGRVLDAIMRRFGSERPRSGARRSAVEVTAECNPTSLDIDKARALAAQGVNRLSIGIQGLDPQRLAFLGRLHTPDGGLEALEAALSSGMPRVSADVIFGVEGGARESPEDAAREVLHIASTGVSHVSAYALTIEATTQFGELARKGKLPIAPDDEIVDAFFAVEKALTGRGFQHYETSNYARPGEQARHNLGYWKGRDYLGLGCGAFGTIGTKGGSAVRSRNLRDPRKYMQAALDRESTADEREELDGETRLRERIMLGLRLAEGVDLSEAAAGLGVEPLPRDRKAALDRLLRQGKVEVEGSRVRVAPGSRALIDGIASALF